MRAGREGVLLHWVRDLRRHRFGSVFACAPSDPSASREAPSLRKALGQAQEAMDLYKEVKDRQSIGNRGVVKRGNEV